MKLIKKLLLSFLAVAFGVALLSTPVKAANGIPSNEELYLKKMMEQQKAENAKIEEYKKLQDQRAKAEKRKVSDIEMVKRQAMEGIVTGNNNLLDMGNINLACGQPAGEYNVAFLDQQAYEGYVAGMAELERVKRDTWMQYTFRTH